MSENKLEKTKRLIKLKKINEELYKKISNKNFRLEAINSLKNELSGIYRKNKA